jgi:hypothetical protein
MASRLDLSKPLGIYPGRGIHAGQPTVAAAFGCMATD